jgi:hypothetical protein
MKTDERIQHAVSGWQLSGDEPARELNRRFALVTVATALTLFVGILVFLEVGRQIGLHQAAQYGATSRVVVGVVDGPIFGLTALLIGFAFSGAAARFEKRRELVADEARMAVGAWARIDTLHPDQQIGIRDGFRRYLDALLAWYTEATGAEQSLRSPGDVDRAKADLWSRSVAACLDPLGEKARMLLLPSLSDMFAAVEKERLARRIHPPLVIFAMLGVSALASALFLGYGLSSGPTRPWLHMLGVAVTISVAAYVILELEFPRLGLVRVGGMDRALAELRASVG